MDAGGVRGRGALPRRHGHQGGTTPGMVRATGSWGPWGSPARQEPKKHGSKDPQWVL